MSARDEAIEAAARQIVQLQGYEPSDDRPVGTAWLASGESILAAAVPVLLNDLADRIEQIPMSYGSGPRRDVNRIVGEALALVRAAAEGWGA